MSNKEKKDEIINKLNEYLEELQIETLKFIKKVRKQFTHAPWEEGMNDLEFLDQVASPLEDKIRQDREILNEK